MIRGPLINRLRVLAKGVPLGLLADTIGSKFIAPFYHTVSDRQLPHIRHLYRYKNIREFEKDLEQLLAIYEPIDIAQLHLLISDNRLKEKKRMLLSFDDGLCECSDVIAPILQRKGVGATFFINPSFVGNRSLMFRYKASLLIDKMKTCSKIEREEAGKILNCRSEKLTENILAVTYSESEKLDQVAEKWSLCFNEFLNKERPYMDVAEIEGLKQQGFDIGAHSMDHPYYSKLPENMQHMQTQDSIDYVQRLFKPRHDTFAFPFTDDGVSAEFIRSTLEKDAELTFGTAGIKKDVHARHIQRIPMEGSATDAKAIINAEYLYYLLKAPFGKNLMTRK